MFETVRENRTNTSLTAQDGKHSFFKSRIQPKLTINQPNDVYEQEADVVADKVMSAPADQRTFVTPAPASVQREEKTKPTPGSDKVLTEGVGVVLDELEDKPGFDEWEEEQIKKMKYKLWDSQPQELKLGVVGFGLANVGLLGTVLAADPGFRHKTADTFQDLNVALPLRLVPGHEYFLPNSFKYKLPSAQNAAYTFETEFKLDTFFDLARKHWNTPKISLNLGIDSSYSEAGGFRPVTGGSIKLKLFGGAINITGAYNQHLLPSPALISDPSKGDAPMWLMQSLPDQSKDNLPKGNAIFFSVDVVKVIDLLNPSKEAPRRPVTDHADTGPDERIVPRKATAGSDMGGQSVPPLVHEVLASDTGLPLENDTRQFMESRFDKDFSNVRIHTDSKASASADAIQAKAYTSGSDIVFNSSEYQPSSASGQNLLAHELVHVIQQSGAVQRKEGGAAETAVAEGLRTELEAGHYVPAWLKLNDYIGNDDEFRANKKAWLKANPAMRFLFLKHLPGAMVAEIYTAAQLALQPAGIAYSMIDCWYQDEEEKQTLYLQYPALFTSLIATVSPYTGELIADVVKRLTTAIPANTYSDNKQTNIEFHTIHLLAPTPQSKIEFYNAHEYLFKAVTKKFDPFTGITIASMERLTDTNSVDSKRAIEIYTILKDIPEEKRRAFLDTALFAGSLEAEKDAAAFYEKKYKAQYKALPHNWDFALLPWNWNAPFADRVTVDHAALMSQHLTYEYKATRAFGFDTGIDTSFNANKGQVESDASRLIDQLIDQDNFNDPQRLRILLGIAVRGRLQQRVITEVLKPKQDARALTPVLLAVVEKAGFIAAKQFEYSPDAAANAEYTKWLSWYLAKQTVFGGKSSKIIGEQRVTVDLPTMQATDSMLGSLGGVKIGGKASPGDEMYNNEWLDKQVKGNYGSDTLLANLGETKGANRQGKIFASIRDDVRQTNIYASSLPIEGLNYFADGTLYRSGPGTLQGLAVHISWSKDSAEDDNSVEMVLGIENLEINNFELVAPKSTMAMGKIAMKGMQLNISKSHLNAPPMFFRNARLTVAVLMDMLPDVLKLLPYAVMTLKEEFKGDAVHVAKDKLGAIMNKDFYALKSTLTFSYLDVSNLYDTTAGFLDDFSIGQLDKEGKALPSVQKLEIQETGYWTIDAGQNIRKRIRAIDLNMRSFKADVVARNMPLDEALDDKKKTKDRLDEKLLALENERKALINTASDKSLRYEDNSKDVQRLREIASATRELTNRLEAEFAAAKGKDPFFSPLLMDTLNAEKDQLLKDLDYLDNHYVDDKKIAGGNKGGAVRYDASKRKVEFEAKYKSADVDISLQNITLKGGKYLRDIMIDLLKANGFKSPTLSGIENIQIGSIASSFTASGKGATGRDGNPAATIKDIQIELIEDPFLSMQTEGLVLEAGTPRLEAVTASVAINFAANPLDKDPSTPFSYNLSSLTVKHATFNGLKLQIGNTPSIVNFPATTPVEVWGFHLTDYDSVNKNINVSIRDIKAQGAYKEKMKTTKTEPDLRFGIDTTLDNATEAGSKDAIDVHYNRKDKTILTKLNIASAWLPSIDMQSPELSITSLPGTQAIKLTNITADVKVNLEKKQEDEEAARPLSIEINSLHVGEIMAQGIKVVKREAVEGSADGKKKPVKSKIQEITIPKDDNVSIKDIDVSGLRITLGEAGPRLTALTDNASVQLGKTDLSGIGYAEKNAKGDVLRTIALQTGRFSALSFKAANRKGREYTEKEFFKFFSSMQLSDLDVSGAYNEGKTSVSIGIKGSTKTPISVEQGEEKGKTYFDVRMPLSRITVPGLHLEMGDHVVTIPKPTDRSHTSYLNDVDIKLRAYVERDTKDNIAYDIYLQSMSIADMGVYGLEYENKKEGIEVKFEKTIPLHIPNVKAGGFHFSSSRGLDVFGAAGGHVEAGGEEAIEGGFAKIQTRLEDGSFLAEKDAGGYSALTFDIASLGFSQDKDGNRTIKLGKMHGGFPNITINQTDPDTKATTATTIKSTDKAVSAEGVTIQLNANKSKVIEASGIAAGSLTVVSTETKGSDVSITTLNLKPDALHAGHVTAKLNADSKEKEITISDIHGGQINIDMLSTGVKGKSVSNIQLPNPEDVNIHAVKILIDKDGHQVITIVQPTLKHFQLRMPSAHALDYTNLFCDLVVDGDMQYGDGNFDTMDFAADYNASILKAPDNVPVQIQNLQLEYRDTFEKPKDPKQPAKPLTADQNELLRLEKIRDDAKQKLANTPETKRRGKSLPFKNPDYPPVKKAFDDAQQAYDAQKAIITKGAKAEAASSMTKKYLDAVHGNAKADMAIFDSLLSLNVDSYNGEEYVEISDAFVGQLKPIIISIIGTTVSADFWNSKAIKKLAGTLQHWYISVGAPSMAGHLDAFVNGNGIGAVINIFKDAGLTKGTYKDDPNMFGLNINLNSSWAMDLFDIDEHGILSLCEKKYQHPSKPNFYKLYGIIENVGYVSPAIVTQSGKLTDERLKNLLADQQTQDQLDDLSIKENALELIAFLTYSFGQETDNIVADIKSSVKSVSVDADVSLTPQDVIKTLLKERNLGHFTFDKGKQSIDDVHIHGLYHTNAGPEVEGTIGAGADGSKPILVPGGTYLSQDRGKGQGSKFKVKYDSVNIEPLDLTYKDDVYKLVNKNILLNGLRVGIRKK